MDNTSGEKQTFNSKHFLISLLTTALIFTGIISWAGGCHSTDHSLKTATVKEPAHVPE